MLCLSQFHYKKGLPAHVHLRLLAFAVCRTCRHVLFAPSVHNSYAGTTFPGLVDSLFGLDNSTDSAAWRLVEKQFSIVTFVIEAAAASLARPSEFS